MNPHPGGRIAETVFLYFMQKIPVWFNNPADKKKRFFLKREKKGVLCPNCQKLISSDESACPYCGLANPGAGWKIGVKKGEVILSDWLIKGIIGINAVYYILSLLLFPAKGVTGFDLFNMLGPSGKSMLALGAGGTIPIDRFGMWWSLVSANYLHGSLAHILFNMVALTQIGSLVIREYGASRTVIIYVLTGAAGFAVSYFAGVQFTIGASASVCGMIGAALYFGRSRGGTYGEAVFRQTGIWLVTIFIIGFLPGLRINNWAHGAGALTGVILGLVLGYEINRKTTFPHRLLAVLLILFTAGVLIWSACFGVMLRINQ